MSNPHTLINLRDDVDDAAPNFGHGDAMEVHFPGAKLGLGAAALSLQHLKPGQRQPFGHRHRTQEEVYVVVEGGGNVRLDDADLELRRWDAVRVPKEVARAFAAGPEGLTFVAFGAPRAEDPRGEAEVLPDFWGG
jgi:uncharacterized cupin superfamily protein